jgi:hypothetical protein
MSYKNRELVCGHCGAIGEPNNIGLGLFSGLVAIFGSVATMVGLALFVVPGLIIGVLTATHILYYQNKNGFECRRCHSQNTKVPTDTHMKASM